MVDEMSEPKIVLTAGDNWFMYEWAVGDLCRPVHVDDWMWCIVEVKPNTLGVAVISAGPENGNVYPVDRTTQVFTTIYHIGRRKWMSTW